MQLLGSNKNKKENVKNVNKNKKRDWIMRNSVNKKKKKEEKRKNEFVNN